MPTGRGFADFVYIPKQECAAQYPALVIELKWNQNAYAAIDQILDRQYPESIKPYAGEIILVGINYDKKSKEHQCQIQQYKK